MKWYKKQLDLLKISQAESSEPGVTRIFRKGSVNSLGGKKILPHVKNFRNPVAESKRSRSKTDK